MSYSILILLVCGYAYNWNKIPVKKYYLKYLPIFILLFLFVGLQFNVGTDYNSYLTYATNDELGIFKLNQLIASKEYLFALIVRIAQLSGYPQTIFLITSFIQNLFLMLIVKKISDDNISIFNIFVLYFGLSLCFFNQFNGIRQFIAIYIFIYSFLVLSENISNVLGWGCLIITPLFHKSSIFMILVTIIYFLGIYILKKLKLKFNIKRTFIIFSILSLLFYFLDLNSLIYSFIKSMNIYQSYLTSSYVTKMSISEILTKILKLIVVIYSIYRLNLNILSRKEKMLFSFSLISVLVMFLSFSSSLIWRMYLFFDFFIMIPVLLFFKYSAKKYEKIIIFSYLYMILAIKVILLPKGEYLYRSILGRG